MSSTLPSKWGDREYFDIEIEGRSPDTEIWLGDDAGHLVQKEVGTLRSRLIPGDYVVEFGLGRTCYPIRLRENVRQMQSEIEAGPFVRATGSAVSR